MMQGNDVTALLNYNEVASIFKQKKETLERSGMQNIKNQPLSKNLAICFNNIACIHARQKEFQK